MRQLKRAMGACKGIKMDHSNRVIVPADFAPGIYKGEPDEVYFRRRLGVATNSLLKIIDTETPGHYLHHIASAIERADEDAGNSEALLIGKAFHACVLEPDRFATDYLTMPDFGPLQSSKNRATRDEWLNAQPASCVFLKPEQLDLVKAMRESLLKHKIARLLVEKGEREVVFRWIDEETGTPCQSKIDLWDEEMAYLLDLKSTISASPEPFARSITNYRYHVQACMYANAARELGFPISNFLMVPVEKAAPHFTAVYHIDAAAEERGFEILRRSIQKLTDCMKAYVGGADPEDAFPAYGNDIRTITLPGWAYSN